MPGTKAKGLPPSPNKRLHLLLLWRERSPSCELGEAGGDAEGRGGGEPGLGGSAGVVMQRCEVRRTLGVFDGG